MVISRWYGTNFRGGITAVVVYSPVIFAQAGYGPTKASWISALNNTFGILGTFMSAFLIDRFGRRKLLFFGSAGCSISMFLGGAFSKLVVDHPDKAEQYGAAATLFLFLFTLCFSTTWLMVTWICIYLCPSFLSLDPTEIFPTEVRAKGNSFAVAGFAVGCGWTTL
jgi:MFS family permease